MNNQEIPTPTAYLLHYITVKLIHELSKHQKAKLYQAFVVKQVTVLEKSKLNFKH